MDKLVSSGIAYEDPRRLVPGMKLPSDEGAPSPLIANALEPFDRSPGLLVWEGYGNDRFVRLSVRPGMRSGQFLGLSLQMWGAGKGTVREGQPAFVTKEEDARVSALRWVEAGR